MTARRAVVEINDESMLLGAFNERTDEDDPDLTALRGHAVDAADDGIVITDRGQPDNPVIDVNPAFVRLTGYPAAAILGRNFRLLQGPGTDPEARRQIRDAVRDGRDCRVAILNYRQGRTPFWNDLHVSPVRDPRGRITHFIGILHDVSARRAAEERLAALAVANAHLVRQAQAAVRDRDRFLSIAAHELRTPVAGIKGYAQLLLRGLERRSLTSERLANGLMTIDRSTNHLASLTDDLIDVSRLRLGELPLRPVRVSLATLVRQGAKRATDGHDLEERLEIDVETDHSTVLADPERIDQVLAILLDNAARYSSKGGVIGVAVRRRGGGVEVAVTDQGIGLPPGAGDLIFEPFGRAANAVRRSLPGLGLGLSISRGIVARHGGRIWARSAGEDRGTTVGFWLPGSSSE